jgi:hypothetical protein
MLKNTKIKKVISVNNLLKDLKLPNENNQIFTIENNGNSIFDYFLNICSKEIIENVLIVSYRIAKKDLNFLEEIKKKYNHNFKYDLILSDSIPTMVVGTFNYLNQNENFNTKYINTHIKLCCVKSKENYYCIFSSGNFNPDGKIEQLQIFNSKEIFDNYTKLWQEEIKI